MSEQTAPTQEQATQTKRGFFARIGQKISSAWTGVKKGLKAFFTGILLGIKAGAQALGWVAKWIVKIISTVISFIAFIVAAALLFVATAITVVLMTIYKAIQFVVLVFSTPYLLIKGKDVAKADWHLHFAGWKFRNFTCMTLSEVALREHVREQDKQQEETVEQENLATVHHVHEAQQKKGHPTPKQKRSHYRQRTAEARRAANPATA